MGRTARRVIRHSSIAEWIDDPESVKVVSLGISSEYNVFTP